MTDVKLLYKTTSTKYDNYQFRFATIYSGFLIFWMAVIVGFFLATNIIVGTIFLLVPLLMIKSLIKCSRNLIEEIRLTADGRIIIKYLDYSKRLTNNFALKDIVVSIKYPHRRLSLTPLGLPNLRIYHPDIGNIIQYPLKTFIGLWSVEQLKNVFISIKEHKNETFTSWEKGVLERMEIQSIRE